MRYPKFLEENGTIGFVAPSFGCATEPYISTFASAKEQLKRRGFSLAEGPNCQTACGVGISNTPKLCGEELNVCYQSTESDVLISCGGGELMCEVVSYIDFERLREGRPKWFMGYSDNTNFTYLSATLMDTAAIYGPCAGAFGMSGWHPAVEDALMVLRGQKRTVTNYPMWERTPIKDEEHPLVPYHLTEPFAIRRFPDEDVRFTGRLLGGCLDSLVTLLGTRFDRTAAFAERYKEDGIIWFLEACDLNLMGIRRALWQMKEAGWFSHVKGFLIGRPYCYGAEEFGIDHYRAFTDALLLFDVPILMDLDIGHLPRCR